MTLTSIKFLIFTAVFLVLYYIFPRKYRWTVLLAASGAFYAIVCLKYVSFILITIVTTYLGGLLLGRYADKSSSFLKSKKAEWDKEQKKQFKQKVTRNKKLFVAAVLLLNFGILAFLKYYNFFADSITALFHMFGATWSAPNLGLILPLGISFYTFQSMGYIIDIYRGKYKPERNIAKFALFVSFFPQIVQGPISIYDDLAPQLYNGNKLSYKNIKFGMELILWGFFKKLIIADRLVNMVLEVSGNYQNYSGTLILISALLYAVQLYADFSGGIDITRGVAEMFGINLAENFRRPYFSRSISEYWRRWHITLGAWLKNYLFYPVAMSKLFQKFGKNVKKHMGVQMGKVLPTSIASLITFTVIGIWHGANWKYVGFGLWNGGIIMISTLLEPQFEKWKNALKIKNTNPFFIAFQMIRTFIVVLIGYYFDIAPGFAAALRMMYLSIADFKLSDFIGPDMLTPFGLNIFSLAVAAACLIIVLIASIIQERSKDTIREKLSRKPVIVQYAFLITGLIMVVLFGIYGPGYNPADFVYMQF